MTKMLGQLRAAELNAQHVDVVMRLTDVHDPTERRRIWKEIDAIDRQRWGVYSSDAYWHGDRPTMPCRAMEDDEGDGVACAL